MTIHPHQKAAVAALPASIFMELEDIATLLQTEPREATVDATEARPAATPTPMRITAIDTAALDHLLAPYMGAGLLRTHYERITGATEYRGPTGRLMALSIGAEHYCHADAAYNGILNWAPHKWTTAPAGHGSMDHGALARLVAATPTPIRLTDTKAWDDVPHVTVSPALFIQQCGRAKRIPQPVQWALENPMTGEVVERGEFRDGKMFSTAKDWADSMLNRGDAK